MAKNRVLFALWLLLWLSIWLWGSGNAAGFLLLASLLAAALEISLSLLVRRRITASLSAPVSCRKGEDLTVELRASNACFFSCAGLRAVLRDVDLAVLIGTHGTRINVDIGVELLRRNLEPARFENSSERRRGYSLSEAGDNSSGHKDILCH